MDSTYVRGKFKYECKNRFRCVVNIENEDVICYVASSARLDNYVDLRNRDVLLRENNSQSKKTAYTLFAVEHEGTNVLLELGYINNLLSNYLILNDIFKINENNIISEKFVDKNYKADLLIVNGDNKICVEAKAILTLDKETVFPIKQGERALKQLDKLKLLLYQGYEVNYWLVLLNPNSKTFSINSEQNEYLKVLKSCIDLGMKLLLSKVLWNDQKGFVIDSHKVLDPNCLYHTSD